MEISFKNNSCRLTIPTLMWTSKSAIVYIRCSLTIKWKKVLLNQLFEEAKWESGLRVSNYFQYAVYLESLLACIENSILCLSFFLFLSPPLGPSPVLLLCHFVPVAHPPSLAWKKTSDTDIISRKINCIRCCGFHFIRLRRKIPSRFRAPKR